MIDLDLFINKAVKDVKNAKKQGKEGNKARKELKPSAAELEKIKEQRRLLIYTIAEAKWKDSCFVLYTIETKCPGCGAVTSVPCGVHKEQVHADTGAKRSHEIEHFKLPTNYHVKREVRIWEHRTQYCSTCFQHTCSVPEKITIDCHPDEAKAHELFRNEERRYYASVVRKFMRQYLPKVPLLTYQPETI